MLGRRLSHVPTFASLNVRYKKTFGHKFRDAIATCGSRMKPIRKYIFPNFLVVHYFYIILVSIIASILMYPVKNVPYIDILFIATGATTQGGLNTVDTNTLSLYQQIIIYLTCICCTPIVIHGCLAFVRLYWFERYFDNIRDSSKKNYKMRRTKTILGREMTTRTTSRRSQRTAHSGFPTTASADNDNFQEKLFSGKMLYRDEAEPGAGPRDTGSPENKKKNGVDSNGSSWSSSNTVKDNNAVLHSRGGLVFKEPGMRKPNAPREGFVGRRKSTEISPEDMYMSIQMMQGQHQDDFENAGPALVIGAPNERSSNRVQVSDSRDDASHDAVSDNVSTNHSSETHHDIRAENAIDEEDQHPMDSSRGAEQRSQGNDPGEEDDPTKPSIQFDVSALPRRQSHRRTKSSYNGMILKSAASKKRASKGLLKRFPKGKDLRLKLRRRLSSTATDRPRVNRQRSLTDEEETTDKDNMEEYFADNESDEDEDDTKRHDTGNNPVERIRITDDLARVPSASSGIMPRSFTMDAKQAKNLDHLTQSPEFQTMIYRDWKRRHRKQNPLRRKSWTAKRYENEYAAGFPWMQETFNSDDSVSPGHDSDQADANIDVGDEASSNEGLRDNHIKTTNDIADNPENRDLSDEEQGYYGLTIDPDFLNNPRPRISRTMSANYLSWQPTIGRNSTFVGLSRQQREELGGIEYTSIKLLCRILVIYYVGFMILSFVLMVPWILSRPKYKQIVRENGVSPTWWGFFTAMSAFTDLGLTVTRDSMSSFNEASYPLLVMIWFIIIGNTGFPVLLRFIIWVSFKIAPELSQTKENLGFLLDHPRRCFTLLFPSAATWWLLATLIGLNGFDLVLFIILDFGAPIMKPLAKWYRVLDGLFQGVSTRTAGFSVVNISQLHPAVQVSYMLMMYVSVLPLAISIRRTNVYEEQSLGLYGEMAREDTISSEQSDTSEGTTSGSNSPRDQARQKKKQPTSESFIGAHLRKQLSFDMWFLFLGLFIICLCEGGKIKDTSKPDFNIFAILFEIVSAYGTVGLSLGFPNFNTSFSGQFNVLSKLVIIAMLIRGRHRGLPYALDRAIMLPSDRLDQIDHIEDLKLKRTARNASNNIDPVTAYFKKKSRQLHSGLRRVRGSVAEVEPTTLHSYEDHHELSSYNLPGVASSSDHPLQEIHSTTSPYSQDSPHQLEELSEREEDSYDVTAPASYRRLSAST